MIKKIINIFTQGSISKKIILFILLISIGSTAISTTILTFDRYNEQKIKVQRTFKNIELGYNNVLAQSLWTFDSEQITIALEGIYSYPQISYLILETKETLKRLGQKKLDSENIEKKIILNFKGQRVGSLTIGSDFTEIVNR